MVMDWRAFFTAVDCSFHIRDIKGANHVLGTVDHYCSPRELDFLAMLFTNRLGELEMTRGKEGWEANSMASALDLANPQAITGPG